MFTVLFITVFVLMSILISVFLIRETGKIDETIYSTVSVRGSVRAISGLFVSNSMLEKYRRTVNSFNSKI